MGDAGCNLEQDSKTGKVNDWKGEVQSRSWRRIGLFSKDFPVLVKNILLTSCLVHPIIIN